MSFFTLGFLTLLIKIIAISGAQDHLPIIELPGNVKPYEVQTYLNSLDVNLDDGTDCSRPCVAGKRRICLQILHVENYHSMGPACRNCSLGNLDDCYGPQCLPTDGFEKGVISINRQIPGPLIEACQFDLMVIRVENLMHSETFSLHWHGQLQTTTPHMDGVPYVTQCPINPGNSFLYTFSAIEAGTYFYHSHSGMQRYNGAYGGLIIRSPEDHVSPLYDVDSNEHVMLISDWSHESVEMFFIGLPTRRPGLLPEAILINGRGKYYDEARNVYTPTPYETLYVETGKRYRFRIINSGSGVCPIQIQIQGHRMTAIATDGDDVLPTTIDTLFMHTGERYDVVLEANHTSGMFWFVVKTVGACTNRRIFQTAVISYEPDSKRLGRYPVQINWDTELNMGVTLNNFNGICGVNQDYVCVTDLRAPKAPDYWRERVNQRIVVNFGVRPIMNTTAFFQRKEYTPFLNINGNNIFLAVMNGISYMHPPSTILSQGYQNSMENLCDATRKPSRCNNTEICVCTHTSFIKKNALVEMWLIDETPVTIPVAHPIHLHGYKFSVLAQGRIIGNRPVTETVLKGLQKQGLLRPKHDDPPLKDTIAVQNQGYAVIRFRANNPGAWMMHCHVEDHMAFGMAMVFIVGGGITAMPENFPKCGDFP